MTADLPLGPAGKRPPLLAICFWLMLAVCWLLGPLSFLLPWWKTAFASLLTGPVLLLLATRRLQLGADASHRLLVLGAAAAVFILVCCISTVANQEPSQRLAWFVTRYALNPLLLAIGVLVFLESLKPLDHRRAANACLALCVFQAPFYLVQRFILFTPEYGGNYFDRWTGSFPIFADFAMAFTCTMAVTYVLWLAQEGVIRLGRWQLAALAWTTLLMLDQNSDMNRMLYLLMLGAFAVRWAMRSSDPRLRWAAIGLAVTAIALALPVAWQAIDEGLGAAARYVDDRGTWRYLSGTQSDRPGGVIYLLTGDNPFWGYGPGHFSYDSFTGKEIDLMRTRGMIFVPFLETGWLGVAALFAFAFAHLRGITNLPSALLVLSTIAVGLTQELTNLLSMCLAFHVFAFLFAQPVRRLPDAGPAR